MNASTFSSTAWANPLGLLRPRLWLVLALVLAACGPEAKPLTAEPIAEDDFRPTDPGIVTLAAGRPQLIEFFAFW